MALTTAKHELLIENPIVAQGYGILPIEPSKQPMGTTPAIVSSVISTGIPSILPGKIAISSSFPIVGITATVGDVLPDVAVVTDFPSNQEIDNSTMNLEGLSVDTDMGTKPFY